MRCLLAPHSTTSRVLRRTIPLTGNLACGRKKPHSENGGGLGNWPATRSMGFCFAKLLLERFQRDSQPFLQTDFRFPTQQPLSLGDVRAALLGIVLWQGLEDDWSCHSKQSANALGKFQNCNFLRVADVGGL